MSEADHISRVLSGLFSNPQNGWFPPFTDATARLNAAQAAWVPSPGMNSAWALANHVRFWQEVVLLRLRGEPVDRQGLGAEDGWPPPGDAADEPAWREAGQRAIAVNTELADLVAGLSAEDLARPTQEGKATRWQVLHGLIGHTSYHTGQIVTVRRLQGSWIVDWRERLAVGKEE